MRRVVVGLVVGMLVLAACGGGGDGSDTPTGPTAGPSDEAPAPDTGGPAVGVGEDPDATGSPPVTGSTPPPGDDPAGPPDFPAFAREIQQRGVVRVGVNVRDMPPFISYAPDEDLYVGFEGTIARLLIAGTLGPIDIEYVPLTGGQRFEAITNGAVDLVLRMTAITEERRELAFFTTPYLMAGVAVMVPVDSPIMEITDLADARLAVTAGSEMRVVVGDKAKELGFPIQSVQVGDDRTPWDAVVAGDADGYIDSWALGVNRAHTEGDVRVIPIAFSEGIAAFTSPLEIEWGTLLDHRLRIIIESGVWAEDFQSTFGFPPPWTIEEMQDAG